jgi:hypothetical protein
LPLPISPTQPKTNVISPEATDGLIVRCAVERSLYFVFALPLPFCCHPVGIGFVLLSLFVPLPTIVTPPSPPHKKSCQAPKHPIHMQINNIPMRVVSHNSL